MKAQHAIVLIVAMVFMEEVSAKCRWTCWNDCSWNGECRRLCGLKCSFRKREAGDEPVPLRPDFEYYDQNGDGFIELSELKNALDGDNPDNPDIDKAFHLSDIDRDGRLSREEFEAESSAFYL